MSFSDHWRRPGRRGPVGIDVEDARLLDSIQLDGMRVSLVVGPSVETDCFLSGKSADKSDVLPALGLINLSSMLLAHGARVVTRDLFLDRTFTAPERQVLSDRRRLGAALDGATDAELARLIDRWVAAVLEDEPAVIGLSARDELDPLGFVLFQRALRRLRQGVGLVVGGGWSAAGLPNERLAEFDHLVCGEGEVPLLLLCSAIQRGWDPEHVPGLIRIDGEGQLHHSELTHALDVLPSPRLEGIDLSLYSYAVYTGWTGVTIPYRFTVGCPYDCAYCNVAAKRRYKLRSVPLVVRDLEQLHADYGVEQFFFIDTAFNVEPRHAEQLVDAMLATGRRWRWADCARPRRLDAALLDRMRRAGCEWLNWGMDTASARLDGIYRRSLPRDAFAALLAQAHACGIRNAVNVIVGMPHEGPQDIEELLAFLEDHQAVIDCVFVFKYIFIPHSDMGVHPDRYGLRLAPGGRGVDVIGGPTWTALQATSYATLERVLARATELNELHGVHPW